MRVEKNTKLLPIIIDGVDFDFEKESLRFNIRNNGDDYSLVVDNDSRLERPEQWPPRPDNSCSFFIEFQPLTNGQVGVFVSKNCSLQMHNKFPMKFVVHWCRACARGAGGPSARWLYHLLSLRKQRLDHKFVRNNA